MKHVDFLIIGGGIAGMVLARVFNQRGRSVVVVDAPNPASATRVAAGLINPVTGKKLVLNPDWEDYMNEAAPFYREWEAEAGRRFFFPLPIHRFFADERERTAYSKKRSTEGFLRHSEDLSLSSQEKQYVQSDPDGMTIQGGGCVDTRALLRLGAQSLQATGAFREETIRYDDIRVEPGSVRWRDVEANVVVFCEGWRVQHNPWFSWIPFRHAQGEILAFSADADLPRHCILNQRKWIAPFPGEFRAGATYSWDDYTETPTAAGRDEIENGLRGFLKNVPEPIGHYAGIRPIVSDSRPVVGIHPAHPEVAILNGLGSKGVLWSPRLARQLADALEQKGEIDAVADVRRNL